MNISEYDPSQNAATVFLLERPNVLKDQLGVMSIPEHLLQNEITNIFKHLDSKYIIANKIEKHELQNEIYGKYLNKIYFIYANIIAPALCEDVPEEIISFIPLHTDKYPPSLASLGRELCSNACRLHYGRCYKALIINTVEVLKELFQECVATYANHFLETLPPIEENPPLDEPELVVIEENKDEPDYEKQRKTLLSENEDIRVPTPRKTTTSILLT